MLRQVAIQTETTTKEILAITEMTITTGMTTARAITRVVMAIATRVVTKIPTAIQIQIVTQVVTATEMRTKLATTKKPIMAQSMNRPKTQRNNLAITQVKNQKYLILKCR